ncbi:methionine adenosyltransferase [Puniceibacterium sediminis]|uniref:S-adenosylmethionine synthase n=1 Tax=Puniceibacterium sediminis TaxID=1608407 RepID=A0A238YUP4_9RHOB|nr:methionine adenosyltransferase [Puniceibacterium sediminis]SNR74303.1 methionine adenosyltransferase [Puniceibacterium sediminis]
MFTNTYLFSSESVSEGHPDKICDMISDAILDSYLAQDPDARVACETLATTGHVTIAGEVRTRAKDHPPAADIARNVIRSIGYDQDAFSWRTVDIVNRLHTQSADIARGVDDAGNGEEGAGDQGIMFGYACRETPALMPAPIVYAHGILQNLATDRKAGILPQLGPDAKSQVTLRYRDGKPVGVETVVLSTQHIEGLSAADIKDIVAPYVMDIFPKGWAIDPNRLLVNPTGNFVIGGPDGDTGLTGRKIIVDTYGGAAPHGGGAFSGKDPTKVDRSAAYVARYLAKNVVEAGLADTCLIQLAYAIGVAEPVSVYLDLKGTGRVDPVRLAKVLREMVPLTPRGIRSHLDLARPIYAPTASYGHFGRSPRDSGSFSWESTDIADQLARAFGAIAQPVSAQSGH